MIAGYQSTDCKQNRIKAMSDAISKRDEFQLLLLRYYELAYTEGVERRDHDTKNADAQKTLLEIMGAYDKAIEAMKAEQQRGEAVAEVDLSVTNLIRWHKLPSMDHAGKKLYLHPEQARQDGKQTRSQLPEGIDRVRNAATGEIQARQDGILTLLHQAYEAYNDGLDWTGDMIDDYERITAAKEQGASLCPTAK